MTSVTEVFGVFFLVLVASFFFLVDVGVLGALLGVAAVFETLLVVVAFLGVALEPPFFAFVADDGAGFSVFKVCFLAGVVFFLGGVFFLVDAAAGDWRGRPRFLVTGLASSSSLVASVGSSATASGSANQLLIHSQTMVVTDVGYY